MQELERQFKANGGTFEEYRVGELFDKIKVNVLKYKTSDLPNEAIDEYVLPALTAGIQNQGLNNYVPKENATILKNVISISANGANTGATFYQSNEFTVLQDAYAIKWVYSDEKLTNNQYLYLVGAISKTIYGNYEWTNKAGWERVKNDKIYIPTYFNGGIAFSYMESYIRELGNERLKELTNYLKSSGLENTELTQEEKNAVLKLRNGDVEWKEFKVGELFEIHPTNAYKLTNSLLFHSNGKYPVVTNSSVNNGVTGYSNLDPTERGNMITYSDTTTSEGIFYQPDDFVGYPHVQGLYPKYNLKRWNENTLMYMVSAFRKSAGGRFDYANKFNRAIASKMLVSFPITAKGEIDWDFMQNLITAECRLAIRGVVEWKDRVIYRTKDVVEHEIEKGS